jgi:hypothetical protein
MRPEQIERVFGRGRLKMATGEHVEVFREAVAPGERRRYTKRFLNTREGDFGQWTEREWRILARLIGHGIACVPDVVQFDRGRLGGEQLVQTYDAGVTVDQWATLLPVKRNGRVYGHVFEDCAHWWALAQHCLLALNVIHPLQLVHLDVKGDNVCIPYEPASFDPDSQDLHLRPLFEQLALIDFAFALISRERLTTPLPIGWQKDYDYQSPRLLAALEAGRNDELQLTRDLDWRCDMYSLAAMLKRYLPEESRALQLAPEAGWSARRYDAAKAFILRVRDCHDCELPAERPHAALIALCAQRLHEDELAQSLERGWTLAREATVSATSASPLTPVTRLAPPPARATTPIPVIRSGRTTAVTVVAARNEAGTAPLRASLAARISLALATLIALGTAGTVLWKTSDQLPAVRSQVQALTEPVRLAANRAADAMSHLVERDPTPGIAARGQATAPVAAAGPADVLPGTTAAPAAIVPAPAPATRGEFSDAGSSRPASAAPSSRMGEASAPMPAPREAPATPQLAPRGTAHAPAGNVAAASTPARQAGTARKVPGQSPRGPSVKAPTGSHPAPTPSSTSAHRSHAWWASLTPPAWLHGAGPGEPPGAKTRERYAAGAATSSLAGAGAEALAATDAAPPARPASVEAPTNPLPAAAPGEAARSPGSTAVAPVAPALSVAKGSPGALPPAATGVSRTAPIEDRSDAVTLALAPSAVAPAPSAVAPAPSAVTPEPHPPPAAERVVADDFAAQGRRTLLDPVPRLARQIEPQIARVLWQGANAYYLFQERAVADAARLVGMPDDAALLTRTLAPLEARRLNDQARVFAARRDILEAFSTQLRAFGANPRDPDVAGNLAQLYLKLAPPQPEQARQIGLLAIAMRGSQFHTARMEDWQTLAVASALAGREADATNALFVTLALAGDAERGCAAALSVLASYGERLRRPVEAMFYRIQAQGRGYDAPACAWPPRWAAFTRLP